MLNDKHNGADSTWNKREYVQDLVNTRAKKTRKDQTVMDFISNKSTEGAAWQKQKRKTHHYIPFIFFPKYRGAELMMQRQQ